MDSLLIPGLELQAELGRGASGVVYRARETLSGRTVAVKVSHPSPRDSPEDVAFRTEYSIHSTLHHPHIVLARDLQSLGHDRRCYLMRYYDAVNLATFFREGGMDPLGEVALAVLEALEYTHGQGILHGDLKPPNILVTRAGRRRVDQVAVADFGHAQWLTAVAPIFYHGTPAYSPSEQMIGWQPHPRVDIYSLGATLFEAVTGRLPSTASSAAEHRDALTETRRPSIADFAPDLADGWAQLLDAMVSPDPSKRPQSASAARAEVERLLRRPPLPRPESVVRPLFPPTVEHVVYGEKVESVLRLLRERGTTRTVLVTGEEGVGKSRFLEEVVHRAEFQGVMVTRGDARDAGASSFRVLQGVRRGGETVDVGREDGAEAVPLDAALGPRIPMAERERLVESLVAGESHGERLYAFDSLESADLDSLALLEMLRRVLEPGSLLCLAATGIDPKCLDAFRGTETLEIVLEPLDATGIDRLVTAHLGSGRHTAAPSPPLDEEEMRSLVAWLDGETGGNPRRIEGCLATLARRGALSRVDSAWRLDKTGLVPGDAGHTARGRALLLLRRLPPRLRASLRVASIAGPAFDGSLLSAAAEDTDTVTTDFIAEALRLGILAPALGNLARLRFRDPEIARAIAASIPAKRAQAIHGRLAVARARTGKDDQFAAEIAEHFEAAGDVAGARREFIRAAEAALRAGAYLEAGRFFRRSWDLHVGEDRAALPTFAGDWMWTLFVNGHFDEAIVAADSLLLAMQGPDASSEAGFTVVILKALCFVALGRRDEGARVLGGLLGNGSIAKYPALHAWALTALGGCETEANHADEARRHLTAARGIGLSKGLPYVAGRAELYLGIQCWREDDAESALAWQARAYDHFVEAKEKDLLPAVWGNQAICHWFLLDARRATMLHRRSAEAYLRAHRRAEAAKSYQNLAHILTETGRWTEADAALVSAERLNRSLRAPRQDSYFAYHRARLALYRGRLHEATEHIERALDVAKPLDDPFVTVGHMSLRGLIELDSSRFDDAARTGEECLVLSRQINYRWGVAKSLYVLGRAERLAGRLRQALACFDQAAETAREAKQPVVLFRVQMSRAELLAERGDSVSPRLLLRECTALADRVDSPLWNAWIALAGGRIALRLGNSEKASRLLASAYQTFAALGAERHKAETLVAQAEAYGALGNLEAAMPTAVQARVLHEALGLPPPALAVEDLSGVVESSATVTRVLAAAADIARVVATVHRLDDVLERILDVANTYLGTERGVIALADPATGRLKVRCARNVDRESIADALEISRSALQRVGEEGEVVWSDDALADPRLSQRESVRRLRIRALVAMPIRWDNEILGALYLDHRLIPNLFGREAREFLRYIASMAAVGIRNAHSMEQKDDEVRSLREELGDEIGVTNTVVGRSERMKDLFRRGVRAAKEGRVILLSGPSGAGKDHFALAFHEKSKRSGDFVHCPLPTLSESLVEAELFGVVRGAATGVEPRAGLLEVAHGGTIFLNEIGDLPLSIQPKLLSFLDRRVYRKVGSSEDRQFDGLVLCATNADLSQKVADGSFRADLFHRLSECVVNLPPLCERVEDIPALTDLFLEEFAQASGRSRHVLHPLARDILMRCPWNGNIRELRACLRRAVDASPTGMIEGHHLESPSLPKPTDPPPPQGFEDETAVTQIRLITDAMARSAGILTRGAEHLGITDARLRRLIVKYGLGHLLLRRHRFPRRSKGEPYPTLRLTDDDPPREDSGLESDPDDPPDHTDPDPPRERSS